VKQEKQASARGHRGPALLEVAERLFMHHGYNGTTIEQIARRAGFSKRTVYLYFKNKDELFLRVVGRGLELLQQRLEAVDVARLAVEQSIAAVLEAYLSFAREHPAYYRMIFQEATAEMLRSVSPEQRRYFRSRERACLGVVAAVIEKAVAERQIVNVDPMQVAVIFWGAAAGILQLSTGVSQTAFTRIPAETSIERAIWTLYAGLRRSPNRSVKQRET